MRDVKKGMLMAEGHNPVGLHRSMDGQPQWGINNSNGMEEDMQAQHGEDVNQCIKGTRGSTTGADGRGKTKLQKVQDMPIWNARSMAGSQEKDDGSVQMDIQVGGRVVATYAPMPHDA